MLDDFSLEITAKDLDGIRAAAPSLPAGTRVHVTFLAGESAEQRFDAVRTVRELGLTPVPHLAARRIASEDALESLLDGYVRAGAVDHVFVVGGDPAVPEGPFSDALGVIRSGRLEAHGVREVGVAGYPEGHPDITTAVLTEHLDAKAAELRDRGLAPAVVTQFGFDVDPVMVWVRDVRHRGIVAPLRIGVPGPTSVRRLIGFARRFGIGANAMIVKKYGFSLANLMGTAGPERFVRDLGDQLATEGLADGVSLHFYTFGGVAATADWVANARVDGGAR